MKFIYKAISMFALMSNQALAHTDHVMGEGAHHTLYHALFWVLLISVAGLAYRWISKRKSKNTNDPR